MGTHSLFDPPEILIDEFIKIGREGLSRLFANCGGEDVQT